MKVAFASGKGGTGKTLFATNLAYRAAGKGLAAAYVDVDVEAPNGHLFLVPSDTSSTRLSVEVPFLKTETCSGCGECQKFCAYNAIVALRDTVMLFPELCHSCRGCMRVCPEGALAMKKREIGSISRGFRDALAVYTGTLDVGEARAVPLIEGVLESVEHTELVIIDAPPGTSCSAMASVDTADLVVLVTEPTPFGLHDLTLAVEMCRALGKNVSAVINRSDLGDRGVFEYLEREGIETLAAVPFDKSIAEAYAAGKLAYENSSELANALQSVEDWIIKSMPSGKEIAS